MGPKGDSGTSLKSHIQGCNLKSMIILTWPLSRHIVFRKERATMIRGLKRWSGLVLILAFGALRAAYAQETAALSDDQVRDRLNFIENALDSAQPNAKIWWYGWLAAYSAGALAQGGLSIAHWNDVKPADSSPNAPLVRDRAFAQDMLVGGATTVLGVGGLLIDPFLPAYGPHRLRSLPENTPEERRAKLLKAEELLRQCAQREKDGRGLKNHLVNIGVNAAAGLVTVLVFDRPFTDGLFTFAAGEAVSLITIVTQPRRAIRDLKNYEVKYLGQQGTYIPEAPSDTMWTLGLFPGGISLGLRF